MLVKGSVGNSLLEKLIVIALFLRDRFLSNVMRGLIMNPWEFLFLGLFVILSFTRILSYLVMSNYDVIS